MGDGPHAITFWQALQLMLIGLKLTGHIGWPWYLVLLPAAWSVVLFFGDMIPTAPELRERPDTFRR